MTGFDWFLVAWWMVNIILVVAIVGRPREPLSASAAAISVAIQFGLIGGLLLSRGVL